MTIFSTFPACYLRTPLCLMINDPLLTIQTKFFHSHLCSSYLKYFLSIFVTWVIFSKELIESLIFRKLQLMQIRIFFLLTKPHVCFVRKWEFLQLNLAILKFLNCVLFFYCDIFLLCYLQERSLKAQNAALEKKQHESWVTVRQETRRMTEANTEMQTLRTR